MRFWLALALLLAARSALAQAVYPDPAMTPGMTNPDVTQDNIKQTICVSGWTKTIRPPVSYTDALKKQQLSTGVYATPNADPKAYELDHLISLELGGAPRDPRNLWPEPRNGQWGAHTKDKVENGLHRLVCAGKLPLETARQMISHDWIAAYKWLASQH